MLRDDLLYLGHMLDMARKAAVKVKGVARGIYDQDEDLRFSLIHLIQTIGEAARRVSRATQDAHPEIPWSSIIGMRHKIVHDYMGVDEDLVWLVATGDMPCLVGALERILGQEPPDARGEHEAP
jgi:uncharacterized protein with HEPN domain